MRRAFLVLLPLIAGSVTLACAPPDDGSTAPNLDLTRPVASKPGEPLPGLSSSELQSFNQGLGVFVREFTPTTGLGPLFNSTSCQECHENPAVGGGGDEIEIQATAYHPPAACDPLIAFGGAVVQQNATPALQALLNITKEPDLPGATGTGGRVSPPVFGLGLLDAIPDRTIKQLAAIPREDGVHGHANILGNGRVGRFGRKANVAQLSEFGAGAFINEMGVTDPANMTENTIAGQPLPAGIDSTPEPELDAASLGAANAFLQFLAPLAPLPFTQEAEAGRRLFDQIRCTSCHLPTLTTGNSPVQALRFRRIDAYSDLLVHNMGSAMADICMESAAPEEFRTQPLMGERFVQQYLHDGRASSVEQAIDLHGGEATVARDRFRGLSLSARAAIVAFVRSL